VGDFLLSSLQLLSALTGIVEALGDTQVSISLNLFVADGEPT
jgi:hypothetical protein